MEIQVLGPLTATLDGVSIVPTASKPRQLLALFAFHPGRIIPVGTLMEELWSSHLPQSAMTTLQTYVLQLRRRLGTAMGPDAPGNAKEILSTRHGGYVLQISADCVDVYRYEQLVADGQRAFESGEDAHAAEHFKSALAMWKGPTLVDVPAGTVLSIEILRLRESRLVTLERRIDADLRLGRHGDLVSELADLIARHPQHEGLHAQAMVALYRAGRQATALDVYRRLRKRLIDELGVEPSPQLQRLHQMILAVDPTLDVLSGERRTSTFNLFAA
ncbi:AfsR/SARP family transcriptional regulator [Streptomyces sp. YC504]|uniref:AfsR/SARP family transcriptional regulator n=1 Tax=Streptomyces mesophilus TaxID=1775132 RepID=A0A6G4XC86_9ACTN|nr:AfsR/SARP family transcriptional regulator [Streptomyces mesophilus]NGO74457.1 AfsR/SARP family transcriptional regulator [Streptomyces mesophilus]